MRYTASALAFSCYMAVTAGFMSTTSAQDASNDDAVRDLRGIDLVVLVDVSGSMGRKDKEGNAANDPERIRWDAVKLILDLLGPADRIMIQRFNESCPAGFEVFDDDKVGREKYINQLMNKWFPDREIGFPDVLQQLTEANRIKIARNIEAFNRTDDNVANGERLLDVGNTRIVGALGSVAGQMKQSSAVRSPHVVLLTDGLDQDYKTKYRGSKLEDALKQYQEKDFSGNGRFPVHIVGLNLKSGGPTDSHLARELLTRIAHLSGGHFFEVENNEMLTESFVELMIKLKGYWFDQTMYDPVSEGRTKLAETLVINGIIDLGILSYEKPTNTTDRKKAIQATQTKIVPHWVSNEKNPLTEYDTRTGKDETLYRYDYFGPELRVDGELGPSPFKDLDGLCKLELTMGGTDFVQRLILLKGTADLFHLHSPAAGAAFYRDQTLDIRVDMDASKHFAPGQFEVSAQLKSVGTGVSDNGEPIEPVVLAPFSNGTERGFRGRLPLSRLVRLPQKDSDIEAYQVAVSIRGKGQPDIPQHALSRNQRDLTPRIFTVRDYLAIRPLKDVELSNASEAAVIDVEVGFPIEEDVELSFKYTPPKSEAADVPAPQLVVTPTPDRGRLILKKGRGTIRLELDRDAMPKHGVVYEPGSVILTHPAGMRMNSAAELTARVRLRLDLGRVGFVPPKLPQLVAGQTETLSGPIKVQLTPGDQSGFDDQLVSVTLKPLPAEDSRATSSTSGSDSETSGNDESTTGETTFGPDELWISRTDIDTPPDERSQSLTGIELGQSLQIHLHARGKKVAGKHPFQLSVTGDQLAPAEIRFDVAVDTPSIELELPAEDHDHTTTAPENTDMMMTLHAAPGERAQGAFNAWLSDFALDGVNYIVYAKESFVGQKVLFRSDNGDEVPIEVACPHIDEPVALFAGKASANSLGFAVHVPEGTPFGRYSAEMELTGPGVNSRTITLSLVVNEMAFDIASTDEQTGEAVWRPCNDREVIHLADHGVTHWLRLRTQLSDSFDNPDQIAIRLAGPFADESGDVINLPVQTAELSADKRSIWLKLEFEGTPNFNSRGDPYTIAVVAEGGKLHVPNAKFTFQVRFLVAGEILKSSKFPSDAPKE